ncbi:MAG: hypothetical protein ABJ327_02130 [Litoreibacter sp.]
MPQLTAGISLVDQPHANLIASSRLSAASAVIGDHPDVADAARIYARPNATYASCCP